MSLQVYQCYDLDFIKHHQVQLWLMQAHYLDQEIQYLC